MLRQQIKIFGLLLFIATAQNYHFAFAQVDSNDSEQVEFNSNELSDPYIQKMIDRVQQGYVRDIKGKIKSQFKFIGYFAGERAQGAFDHSLLKNPAKRASYSPNKQQTDLSNIDQIPRVDVWKYEYLDPKNNFERISSPEPISTLKEHWKDPKESRIIALTLFGNIQKYFDGLLDFVESIKYVKEKSGIDPTKPWGYETFTLRVYVAKRNPSFEHLGPLKNSTSEEFIEKMLKLGFEVAYVDNHLAKVGRDATFWRFMITGEEMKEGDSLRYLVRDVDHKITAAEMFSVGEWINSKLPFHRMHLATTFIGPLTASIFGGVHQGKNGISDIKRKIEHFPYRHIYGDDEIFTKYVIWDHMKNLGGILTHQNLRNFSYTFTNPYHGSSEDMPTSAARYIHLKNNFDLKSREIFAESHNTDLNCVDSLMPKGLKFPLIYLAHDLPLKLINPSYFNLNPGSESDRLGTIRRSLAMDGLYLTGSTPARNVEAPINTGIEAPQYEEDPSLITIKYQIKKANQIINQTENNPK
jgi:hypothetical protein